MSRFWVEWLDRDGFWNLLGTVGDMAGAEALTTDYRKLALRIVDRDTGEIRHLPRIFARVEE